MLRDPLLHGLAARQRFVCERDAEVFPKRTHFSCHPVEAMAAKRPVQMMFQKLLTKSDSGFIVPCGCQGFLVQVGNGEIVLEIRATERQIAFGGNRDPVEGILAVVLFRHMLRRAQEFVFRHHAALIHAAHDVDVIHKVAELFQELGLGVLRSFRLLRRHAGDEEIDMLLRFLPYRIERPDVREAFLLIVRAMDEMVIPGIRRIQRNLHAVDPRRDQ